MAVELHFKTTFLVLCITELSLQHMPRKWCFCDKKIGMVLGKLCSCCSVTDTAA